MKIELTEKQAEYVRNSTHRWNFAVGAVRSGKSHLAIVYTIPQSLMEGHGKKGLNMILGVTQETIERNVLTPMRDIWGEGLVSTINYRGKARLFGEDVYCIGADNAGSVTRLQGTEIKFVYCDEIVAFNQEVFEMLKSRLSLPYSTCHAACNPAGPNHYIREFIDSASHGVDVYSQHYTLWDNPFLPDEYVRSLEAEYAGTVYYHRYVEGLWTQAEGLVYPNHEKAIEDTWHGDAVSWCVSCDYGTQNPFAAIKWAEDADGNWHAVEEYYYNGRREGYQKTDSDYVADMVEFAEDIGSDTAFIVDPSAASFIAALRRAGFRTLKANNAVLDGIRETNACIQNGKVRISRECKSLIMELKSYVWDDKKDDTPLKENDHACDAMRYFVKTKRLCKSRDNYKSRFG